MIVLAKGGFNMAGNSLFQTIAPGVGLTLLQRYKEIDEFIRGFFRLLNRSPNESISFLDSSATEFYIFVTALN